MSPSFECMCILKSFCNYLSIFRKCCTCLFICLCTLISQENEKLVQLASKTLILGQNVFQIYMLKINKLFFTFIKGRHIVLIGFLILEQPCSGCNFVAYLAEGPCELLSSLCIHHPLTHFNLLWNCLAKWTKTC
jgi:hypothetical protein